MKRLITMTLALLLLNPSHLLLAKEDISELSKGTDALYRTGAGAQDGAYTALGMSMFGWGLGLAAGIAILVGVLHQSTASHNGHCD